MERPRGFQSMHQHGLLAMLVIVFASFTQVVAQSTVIYQDIEDIQIFGLGGATFRDLDLDGDGTVDFKYKATGGQFTCLPQNGGRILSTPPDPPDLGTFAIPLNYGDEISPVPMESHAWNSLLTTELGHEIGSSLTSCVNIGCRGLFTGRIAYMGVEFQIDEQIHYGWIRMDVFFVGFNGGWITEYAYETRPGVGIKAGSGRMQISPPPFELHAVSPFGKDTDLLQWNSQEGGYYSIQRAENLTAHEWESLLPVRGTGRSMNFEISALSGNRFYRIQRLDQDN